MRPFFQSFLLVWAGLSSQSQNSGACSQSDFWKCLSAPFIKCIRGALLLYLQECGKNNSSPSKPKEFQEAFLSFPQQVKWMAHSFKWASWCIFSLYPQDLQKTQRQCLQLDYHVHRWQRKFKKWENSNWGVAQKLHNIKCRIHFCSKISKHWSWSKKNFTSVDSWATILHILQVSTDAGMHMLYLKNLDPLQSPRAQFQKHPPSLLQGSSEEICVPPLWIYTH